MRKFLFLAIAIVLSHVSANASDCFVTAIEQDAMNQCAFKNEEESGRTLDKSYQQLLEHFGKDTKIGRQFIMSQQLWEQSRQTECEMHFMRGGSVSHMTASVCRTELNKQRTKHFEDLLNCPEGDVSCL